MLKAFWNSRLPFTLHNPAIPATSNGDPSVDVANFERNREQVIHLPGLGFRGLRTSTMSTLWISSLSEVIEQPGSTKYVC